VLAGIFPLRLRPYETNRNTVEAALLLAAPISATPGAPRTFRGAASGRDFLRPSKRIRTGIRCTTFTKLPVAFSGGSGLVRAPVAPGMFAAYPRHFLEKASTRTSAGRDAFLFELRFLEVGGDPNTLPLADDQQLLAGSTRSPTSTDLLVTMPAAGAEIFGVREIECRLLQLGSKVRTAPWRASVLA
jgi:hypothetical protein